MKEYATPEFVFVELDGSDVIVTSSAIGTETSLVSEVFSIWSFN